MSDTAIAPARPADLDALAVLFDAAAAAARTDGAAVVSLETRRRNTVARALYRAAGWHEDDTQWYSLALAN